MNKEKQQAYKHLLYCSLLEIRSGNNATKYWNPFDWFYSFRECQKNKELADLFHNLAFFIREDFNGFVEETFWKNLKNINEKCFQKYHRIFGAFIKGDMYLF